VAEARKEFTLSSPNGKLKTNIVVDETLTYDITLDGRQLLEPSPIAMTLQDGEIWGRRPKVSGNSRKTVNESVSSPFYRADAMSNRYNELTLNFKRDWSVEFRAYDDGIAYRFVSKLRKYYEIKGETVDYRFTNDAKATVPLVAVGKDGDYESQFFNSFENTYTTARLSELSKTRLMFLPLVVEAAEGVKVCITETDLQDYPGLYLSTAGGDDRLTGVFARFPMRRVQGGHNMLQMVVESRENYIARVEEPRSFPWRVAIVTTSDKDLASTNLSYLLAAPSKVKDTSWIRPGKVAWEWWNNWNLYGVDFEAGVNNDTYKAYIDFASKHGIEYVILDEGWAKNRMANLMEVVPEINLPELVAYGKQRGVGIILWAGYYAFYRDMEGVCQHYANMGIKGFKVDFMDRDDQQMTDFNFQAAAICAKYKLLLDLHGTSKPAGLNRTYPNVLDFEGVFGLEQLKWVPATHDQVTYEVTIPFIRQVSGPMDYTQGAMHNAAKDSYRPNYSEPMSQGTRCRQLGMYMVYDSPFSMLCDSPSNYEREPECTDFIAKVPTTWDETRVLAGEMGEYIITARRKGTTWYVGGLTNWTARDMEIDCSFLDSGTYHATLFRDGVNAHRKGNDYRREEFDLKDRKLKVHAAPGGGFALKLEK
jgi:alpha-glucosidase